MPTSYKSDKAVTQTHHCHDIANLEHQVKQLQINYNTTIDQGMKGIEEKQKTDMQKNTERFEALEKVLVEIQANNDHLKSELSLTQQQLLNVQNSNKILQASNAHLQNQLSLTQQQLLGVQSMMTCSRLWVVSHDQFTIGREIGRGAWATVHETTFRRATVAAKRLHQLITAPRT